MPTPRRCLRLSAVTGRPCGIHLEPRTNTWPHSNAWVLFKRHRSFDRTRVPPDCHGHRHSRGTRVPSDSTWRSRWMADELTADDRCGLEIVRGGGRPDMGGAGRGTSARDVAQTRICCTWAEMPLSRTHNRAGANCRRSAGTSVQARHRRTCLAAEYIHHADEAHQISARLCLHAHRIGRLICQTLMRPPLVAAATLYVRNSILY